MTSNIRCLPAAMELLRCHYSELIDIGVDKVWGAALLSTSLCHNLASEQLHAALVADMLDHYLPAVQSARLKKAQADFADLLFRSRRLLLDRPAARQRLSERFQALLIDEVQDTDPIQAEVATLLARPCEQEGAWQTSTPLPGSLFVVGDPRQSIYRFRRADVQVWEQLRDVVALPVH